MQLPSAVVLVFALMWPALQANEPGAPAGAPVVHSVKIEGSNREVQLETRAGSPLDPDRLTRDVRKLWATGAFDDVRVDREDTPAGTDLVFHVVEKPRLYLHEIKFAPGSERRKIDVKAGGLIDEAAAEQVAAAIRRQYSQEGYLSPQVDAELIPISAQQADLQLDLKPGSRVHVQKVRFSGDLQADPKELNHALSALRSRRMIPLIWTSHPGYSEDALQADLSRVRSFYLTRGYFDANVRLDDVDYHGKKAVVKVLADAGQRYGVRRVELVNLDNNEQLGMDLHGPYPEQDLCSCLFKERKKAEKEGRLDFDVRLVADDVTDQNGFAPKGGPDRWLDLSARIETGPPYTVGRIEFHGNHSFSESTLRRAMLLDEAAVFNSDRLRRSLVRLSQLGVFEPVTSSDVYIRRDPSRRRADVVINLKQKPRGGWSFSGPVGPVSLAGPLQASIASRLPGWGKGLLETSTYFLTFSVLGFPSTFSRLMPFMPSSHFLPFVVLERPMLPGQEWLSGFAIAPQVGWQGMLIAYGMSQGRRGVRLALHGDVPGVAELVIPVERTNPAAAKLGQRWLICEPHKSGWSKLRSGALMLTDLVMGTRPF